jgi:ComF family protein
MIEYVSVENCRGCGSLIAPTHGGPISVCLDCWDDHNEAEALLEICALGGVNVPVASGTTYSGILKKMIYKLKYDDDKTIIDDLVPLVCQAWLKLKQQYGAAVEDAVLVPIPLHWLRMVTRGFNQSEIIAESVGKHIGLEIDRKLMSRRRSTKAQHGLGKQERIINLANAFRANRWAGPAAPPIVLVDDIYTSGATIAAAAAVLNKAGYRAVYAITAARATFED